MPRDDKRLVKHGFGARGIRRIVRQQDLAANATRLRLEPALPGSLGLGSRAFRGRYRRVDLPDFRLANHQHRLERRQVKRNALLASSK